MPKRLLLAAALVAGTPLGAQGRDVGPVIAEIEEDLDAIRGIIADMDEAPESALPFRADKEDFRDDLNRQLDRVLGLVLGDLYPESRAALFALDEEAEAVRARIAELRIERITAPRSEDAVGVWDRTLGRPAPGSIEAIDEEIATREAQLKELETRRVALLDRFAGELRTVYGVEITREEAEAALYQVNGSTIVESAVVFEVIARIEERLREIRAATDEEAVLRRYYAVAAVTRLLVVRLYERHLRDYEEEWLPKLAEIEARNDRLMADTEAALSTAEAGRREAYQGNLEVQRQVDEVIDAYRAMLDGREGLTRDGLEVARKDADVALNTLRTLEAAVSLQSQMLWSSEEFESLMEIAPPELLPLGDDEMFQRFLDVSRELATS
ncbi:hypothetical protein [Rubellimicrobium roseum]|uniref:Uncharacterized protein n=1 Tax=Rubellimicrobium roseum TaxID=687525 RepID=A0A5C4NE53_9RHOB|nr:hypothetical protein [Rubellimicrobium roseum]TNC71628.1 hypothetical protein FHG71_10665 [Rubellimicrobium roseum]